MIEIKTNTKPGKLNIQGKKNVPYFIIFHPKKTLQYNV